MLKKFAEYIVGLSAPSVLNIGGQQYCDRDVNRISYNPKAKEITLSTLTSLVDYIDSGVDNFSGQMIVHVKSPTEVEMYSALDKERSREHVVVVRAELPKFEFGRFIDRENFTIGVQAKFVDDDPADEVRKTDKGLLLSVAGNVVAGTVASYGDNGISQKATIQSGVATKTSAVLPSPCVLRPYRTFHEVEQPASSFVFRMKEGTGDVQCALFEADGGAWRRTAMESIRDYLETVLTEKPDFIVIS